MSEDLLFMVMRRLRAPLITLIVVYAISVGGLALVPGVEVDGHPQRMTILIYMSVIGWAYTLASVIALANDPIFRGLLARAHFARRVRQLAEPFYILCGYGQSGSRLARALDGTGNRVVIVEPRLERIARAAIEEFTAPPLTLMADARLADVLELSGVRSAHCLGLIALAGEDDANQAIAIGARVLNPSLPIVARAKSAVAKINLESFGSVTVINPFDTFADNLAVSLRKPEVLQLEDWLTATPGTPLPTVVRPPRGRWLLVGYGRFGHSISAVLDREGIEWKAFDPGMPDDADRRLQRGDYTESMLRDGGVEDSDALVAGADVDAVNLGAATLGRRVKPDLYVVIRQNHAQNSALIDAASANMKFVQADLMVHECLQRLKTPMLGRFIARMRSRDAEQATRTLERVRAEVGEGSPHAWRFECDVMRAGLFAAFFQRRGAAYRIGHLMADPMKRRERLRASVLMLERGSEFELLPNDDVALKPGDRLLIVGDAVAERLQQRYLDEPSAVTWVCSGTEPPTGYLFRWWRRQSQKWGELQRRRGGRAKGRS